MPRNQYFDVVKPTPKIAGSGLLTLDIIIKENKILSRLAGGSTGNVLTILSFLGWEAYPIVFLGKDLTSNMIIKDLVKWNVKTSLIYRNEKVLTPIIIERVNGKNNEKTHNFGFTCPLCNSRLPRNRLIPKSLITDIEDKMPITQVFYVDRTSRSTLELAQIQKNKGSVIFFEPHKISKINIFKEFLKITDVLKYSTENIEKIPYKHSIPLEIQTLGSSGVRYNINDGVKSKNKFRSLSAFKFNEIIDTAGAGDWLTAGLIHILGQRGQLGFNERNREEIKKAINFGQCLALLNCKYIGARGLMYNLSKGNIRSLTKEILNGSNIEHQIDHDQNSKRIKDNIRVLCPSCNISNGGS